MIFMKYQGLNLQKKYLEDFFAYPSQLAKKRFNKHNLPCSYKDRDHDLFCQESFVLLKILDN